MHEFYLKNKDKFRKQMNGYFILIKGELEEKTGVSYDEVFNKAWAYYLENMLENFPYIGGKKVSGTKNLTGAFYFVALGVVLKDYGVTLDEWGYLSTICYKRYFEKIPECLRKFAGKMFKKQKLMMKMLKKKDRKNKKNAENNPGSFETEV